MRGMGLCPGRWARAAAWAAAFFLAGLLGAQGPAAAAYPDHPVRIIAPFAAGGPTDVIARILAQKLSESLKQQFFVENHVGAGGNLGMSLAARATPDGYTILVASSSYVVNPSLYANNPYDPYKDFIPITLAAASPNIVTVHPSLPVKTMKELIALIQANPGKYSIANAGLGTTPQLASELFKLTYKLDAASVPYTGGEPAVQSVVGNHTPIGFSAIPPAAPQITGGNLRGLAVTAAKRSGALPDVPTMAEAGIPNQESETMQGVFVPAGTPKEVVDLLHNEIVKLMQLPDVKKKCADLGFDVVANSQADFIAYLKKEIDKWHKVIADAKIPQIQ
ncbi:MAG TPA: tripartite tricarboxylate transporter substrate binding protein [Xanthobacteraceae bacterium]|nr:tripartite tricarboxylate transporter substrate binding protein [Xanthobacteraceae bacterium]